MYTTIGAFCRGHGGDVAEAILGMFLRVLWDFMCLATTFAILQIFILGKILYINIYIIYMGRDFPEIFTAET